MQAYLAAQHFVEEDPKGPPVDALGVWLVLNNLRSDVVWCTTECCGPLGTIKPFFAHAKVCNFHVTIAAKHDIVQLQVTESTISNKRQLSCIPVDNTVPVQVPETNTDLRSVKHGQFLTEGALLLDLKHEITTVDKLHHEVEAVLGLERGMDVREKRWSVLAGPEAEHSTLCHGALQIIVLLLVS